MKLDELMMPEDATWLDTINTGVFSGLILGVAAVMIKYMVILVFFS